MILKTQNSIYLIFSLLFAFCSETETEFDGYLRELNIKKDECKIYLLIPQNQCAGCFLFDGSVFNDSVNNRIVVINSHPKAQILNFKNIILDKENIQRTLTFYTGTNLLITENNRQLSVIRVSDLKSQIDSIQKVTQ